MAATDIVSETADRILVAGFNPQTSPWDHKVCVMLITAQGLIDNGGFEYFFENPFDGSPDLQDFPRVYESVGAEGSARAIREAIARSQVGESSFDNLNDVLWRDSKRNYELLEIYLRARPDSYT